MTYYKFVKWEAADIEKVKAGEIPQAIKAAENGNYDPLKQLYKSGFSEETIKNPVYKCGGWAFPFRHLLRKYWIKTRYYGIIEGYAPNKTAIYDAIGKYHVLKIVEI